VGLALCCRRGGGVFLARTKRPSGSASPPFRGRTTAARDTGDMCDCITNHQYGGPGKTALDSESDGNSHIACSSLCRLPPRPTRVVLLTGRKPSLLEAEGSASKDAETSAEEAALTVLRMLYAEQAQYHGHAVDTRRQLREVSTFNSTLSFKILGFNRQGTLSVGRNRSERSGFRTALRGGLSTHAMRQYPKG
jgi:hypothetical protein